MTDVAVTVPINQGRVALVCAKFVRRECGLPTPGSAKQHRFGKLGAEKFTTSFSTNSTASDH